MPDPRNSTALRQLADLGVEQPTPRWCWAIARVDDTGRFVLPPDARLALGVSPRGHTDLRGVCNRVALVVRADGPGAAMSVDGRGRMLLPMWVRDRTDHTVVVGTNRDAALAVVAPPTVLDGLGDLLSGQGR